MRIWMFWMHQKLVMGQWMILKYTTIFFGCFIFSMGSHNPEFKQTLTVVILFVDWPWKSGLDKACSFAYIFIIFLMNGHAFMPDSYKSIRENQKIKNVNQSVGSCDTVDVTNHHYHLYWFLSDYYQCYIFLHCPVFA